MAHKSLRGPANEVGMQPLVAKYCATVFFPEPIFPNNPIVPGVVIIEAMAQTAGVVVSENLLNKNDQSVLFMSINKAKFRKPVLPGYKVKFYVEMINNVKNVFKFMGKAHYDDSLVAESEFSAMITSK